MCMMGQSGIRELRGWGRVLSGHDPSEGKAGTNQASELTGFCNAQV